MQPTLLQECPRPEPPPPAIVARVQPYLDELFGGSHHIPRDGNGRPWLMVDDFGEKSQATNVAVPPGFRLTRDPYSQVGAEMIHRIGFFVGDAGRTANDDKQLAVLDRALKYVGIDLGWEPVPIDPDLQRADDMRFTPITIKDTP